MLDIPGIGSEQVKLYGRKYLPLIRNAKQHYESMMDSNARPQDPNHQNVINLDSDEDEDIAVSQDSIDLRTDDSSQDERSQYFRQDHDVQAFNDRCE